MKTGRVILLLGVLVAGASVIGWTMFAADNGQTVSPADSAATAKAPSVASARVAGPDRLPGQARSAAMPAAVPQEMAGDGSSGVMPPADTPLGESFETLQALARGGNRIAVARLYRELLHCREAVGVRSNNVRLASRLLETDADTTKARKLVDAAEGLLRYSEKLSRACVGVTPRMLLQTNEAVLRAARLGVPEARFCYVLRGPALDRAGLLADPGSLVLYKELAPRFIREGVEAGDWRMVRLALHGHLGLDDDLLSGLYGFDPEQVYRYGKLYQLGGPAGGPPLGGTWASQVEGRLSAEQQAAAVRWAETTYQQYFAGKPGHEVISLMSACGKSEF